MRYFLTLFALGSSLMAAPIQFAGNGHYYELVAIPVTFAQARTAALTSFHLGEQGYLVTITSAAEQAFLASSFGAAGQTWAGGSDEAVEEEWRWLDGPEAGTQFWSGGPAGSTATYANWQAGQPDEFGSEDYLFFQLGQNNRWNDGQGGSGRFYIVEWGTTTGVPEPTTIGMVSGGLALLLVARRRR